MSTLPPTAPVAPATVPQANVTLPHDTTGVPYGGYDPNTDQMKVEAFDGQIVTLGALGDAAATSDTGSFSLMALVKRLLSRFTAFGLGGIQVGGAARQSSTFTAAASISTSSSVPTAIVTGSDLGVKYRTIGLQWTGNQALTVVVQVAAGTSGPTATLLSFTLTAGNVTAQSALIIPTHNITVNGSGATLASGTLADLGSQVYNTLQIAAYVGSTASTGGLSLDYLGVA